jgi:hypothetical protein
MSADSDKKQEWSKFSWRDYKSDEALAQTSLGAQGLWMRMLCIMHDAEPYGYLLINDRSVGPAQLARSTGAPEDQIVAYLDELRSWGVFKETEDGTIVPKGTIYSKRMINDRSRFLAARENGRMGGNPALTGRRKAAAAPQAAGVNPRLKLEKESESDSPPSEGASAPPPTAPDLFGEPPATKPPPSGAGAELFAVGLAILGELTGKKDERALRTLLGKFRKEAAGDDERLLGILREARDKPPADPIGWIQGCLRTPRLVINNAGAPADPWGIQAWCRALPGIQPTKSDAERKFGNWVFKGEIIDYWANQILEASGFAPSWRGDLSIIADWSQSGASADDTAEIIRQKVRSAKDNIFSLRYFDGAVNLRRSA